MAWKNFQKEGWRGLSERKKEEAKEKQRTIQKEQRAQKRMGRVCYKRTNGGGGHGKNGFAHWKIEIYPERGRNGEHNSLIYQHKAVKQNKKPQKKKTFSKKEHLEENEREIYGK